jgi:hypothetical protein
MIRVAVAAIVLVAIVVASAIGIPTQEVKGVEVADLPSIALGQESIYRLEIFLLVFYGGLLVVTPAYRGLVGGKLPIEISARGAKFAGEAADSIEETQKLVDELQEGLKAIQASNARARLNIDQLAGEANVALRD